MKVEKRSRNCSSLTDVVRDLPIGGFITHHTRNSHMYVCTQMPLACTYILCNRISGFCCYICKERKKEE